MTGHLQLTDKPQYLKFINYSTLAHYILILSCFIYLIQYSDSIRHDAMREVRVKLPCHVKLIIEPIFQRDEIRRGM